MLRVIRRSEDHSICLQLEGSLAGPWVQECRRLCANEAATGVHATLDLSGVRYVDAEGLAFVRGKHEAGEVRGVSKFVAGLLRGAAPAADPEPPDEAALVRRHAGRVLALARSLLRHPAAARAVVERAFASALPEGPVTDEATFAARLRRLVGEGCLAVLGSGGPAASAGDGSASQEHPVRRCIDQLPAADRIVLLCRDAAGMDASETAAGLGVPVEVIELRLARARRALMALLRPTLVA